MDGAARGARRRSGSRSDDGPPREAPSVPRGRGPRFPSVLAGGSVSAGGPSSARCGLGVPGAGRRMSCESKDVERVTVPTRQGTQRELAPPRRVTCPWPGWIGRRCLWPVVGSCHLPTGTRGPPLPPVGLRTRRVGGPLHPYCRAASPELLTGRSSSQLTREPSKRERNGPRSDHFPG